MNYIAHNSQNSGGGSSMPGVNLNSRKREPNNAEQQNTPKLANPQPCVLCQKSSVCVCSRCQDFYCSPECQRKDWNRHRYYCIPMPPLVKWNDEMMVHRDLPTLTPRKPMLNGFQGKENERQVTNENTETNRVPIMNEQSVQPRALMLPNSSALVYPKHGSYVMLTGFRTPNRCYIRSLESREHEGFLEVCKALNEYGKTAPKLLNMPRKGELAVTTFKSDSSFYRVEILAERGPNNIRVLYVDYGNTAFKKLTELRRINEEMTRLRKFVVPVALKDVPNFKMDDKIAKLLEQYENFECRVEYTKRDDTVTGIKECVLKSWTTQQSINEKLLEFGNSHSSPYDTQSPNVKGSDKDSSISDCEKNIDNNPKSKAQYMANEKKTNMLENRPAVADRQFDKKCIPNNLQNAQEKLIKKEETKNKEVRSLSARLNNIKLNENEKKIPENKEEEGAAALEPKTSIKSPIQAKQEPVLVPPFETIPFEIGATNIEIIAVDDSLIGYGYFGCLALSDLIIFEKIQKYVSSYEDDGRPYSPKLNEYCLAKFEGEWFRAKVTEVADDLSKFTVNYIDYTNEGTVTAEDIRRYPSDLTFPCCTNLCLIEGLPEVNSPELTKYLKSRFESQNGIKHMITKVKESEENILFVQMNELIEELRKKSLL